MMNTKEREEFNNYIYGLTPTERTKYIKKLSDDFLFVVKIRQDNREYLDKIPDINLRFKEVKRLTDEYKDNERKNK